MTAMMDSRTMSRVSGALLQKKRSQAQYYETTVIFRLKSEFLNPPFLSISILTLARNRLEFPAALVELFQSLMGYSEDQVGNSCFQVFYSWRVPDGSVQSQR